MLREIPQLIKWSKVVPCLHGRISRCKMGFKVKVQLIHDILYIWKCCSSSLPSPSYHFHNNAVWGSTRKHEAEVLCCSHQSSFIWKTNARSLKYIQSLHSRPHCNIVTFFIIIHLCSFTVTPVTKAVYKMQELNVDAAGLENAFCLFFTVHLSTLSLSLSFEAVLNVHAWSSIRPGWF